MTRFKVLFMLLLLSIVSCDTNDFDDVNNNNNTNTNFSENFGSAVSRDFIGQVVDMDNNPVQNANIKIGTATAQTDENGIFIINGANVHERFAYITATKAGFIDGSRSMVPTTGKNNVRIMLLPNTPLETVQSGQVSEVSIYSGTKVVFDGAFQDEEGNAYIGSVSVSMFHLTPTDENISKLMPGMLYAETTTGNEAVLETYGMLNVELRGSAGQKLNIASGHKAEITIRIDDSQIGTAPNTIPLWHFDEENGYWKEDGVATKVGNKYVGEVSHFSWWNCDYPFDAVTLTASVNDSNGNPVSNVGIGLIANGNSYPVMGYTDANGNVSGLIPANQTLVLNIYDNCGGAIIYTTTIGPFSADATLPTMVMNSSVLTSQVVGNLLKCDNTNVTNGYVILSKNGYTYNFSAVTNGTFTFNEMYCSNDTEFKLKGVDYENLQTTDSITYNFTTPITNVGNLTTCNAVTEFISYQIDGGNTVFVIENVGVSIQGTNFTVFGSNNNSNNEFAYIAGASITPGSYTTADGFSYIKDGNGIDFINITDGVVNNVVFQINGFGSNAGDYVDMTVNGTYNDSNNASHTINAVVHVLRDN